MAQQGSAIAEVIAKNEQDILKEWIDFQLSTYRRDLINTEDLREQSRRFLGVLCKGLADGDGNTTDLNGAAWTGARELLEELSRARARQGFSPSETATFVFSLKQPLFDRLQRRSAATPRHWQRRSGRPRRCSTSSGSTRPRSSRRAARR